MSDKNDKKCPVICDDGSECKNEPTTTCEMCGQKTCLAHMDRWNGKNTCDDCI